MQIDVQSQGFALTHALGEYAERRLQFAPAHAGGRAPGDLLHLLGFMNRDE